MSAKPFDPEPILAAIPVPYRTLFRGILAGDVSAGVQSVRIANLEFTAGPFTIHVQGVDVIRPPKKKGGGGK